jgi:hypothetical protein
MIDFPLNLRDGNENWAWYEGSRWLSLDRFERFWPDVGLMLTNGEAVKSAVREVLRVQYAADAEWRAAYAADPDAPEDPNAPDPTKDLGPTFFRQINDTAGTQDAECVARWLTGPVLGAIKDPKWTDKPNWHYAWTKVLCQLAEEDPNRLVSPYGIPAPTAQSIVEIAARYLREVRANGVRVEAADQEPLLGWDAIAYADCRWECPEPSPLDGLWMHLRYISFDRAWEKIIRCTRATDLDALIQWGREYAATRMSTSIQDEDVIIPDDVRAAWSDLHAKPA